MLRAFLAGKFYSLCQHKIEFIMAVLSTTNSVFLVCLYFVIFACLVPVLVTHCDHIYCIFLQLHSQCNAFRAGLSDVIDLKWLQIFSHHELQVIITISLFTLAFLILHSFVFNFWILQLLIDFYLTNCIFYIQATLY